MSQAEDLLNSLTVYEDEPHIVINADRTLTIPAGLKKIAVQHDHNIETVTIDCPRYWDGIDMSSMEFYINYKRADGELGSYIVRNPIIDSSDDRIVHFDWTISSHVTAVKGKLLFLVCIMDTDSDGIVKVHWNSELSDEMYIAEGLEVSEHIEESYPDVISQLIHMSEEETAERIRIDHEHNLRMSTIEDMIRETKSDITSVDVGHTMRIDMIEELVNKKADNILDGTATGSLNQLFDGEETLDFTTKNPNATSVDASLTGSLTKGATGNYAISLGGKSIAMGKRSVAEGTTTIAKGNYSHAEGDNTVALGNDSHAECYRTLAQGTGSHSEGIDTIAKGSYSHSEGNTTISTGNFSHSEGLKTESKGEASHAEGTYTTASGYGSHSEGSTTKANGDSSHAEGITSKAVGKASHAEGTNTEAIGVNAHAEGHKTIAGAIASELVSTYVDGSAAIEEYTLSDANGFTIGHYFGECIIERNTGRKSFHFNVGKIEHISGNTLTITMVNPVTDITNRYKTYIFMGEPYSNSSTDGSGSTSTTNNVEMGSQSHTEGNRTIALGNHAHAEGNKTKAFGEMSHSEGYETIAHSDYQHVQGKFNIEDADNKYADIIGNGTSDTNRSNAHTLDWNGNAWYQGDIKIGGNSYDDGINVATETELDKKQDKVTISEYPEDNTELIYDLSIMHNNELRTKSTLANGITFIIPNEVHPDDYVTSLSFNTGDIAPQIGYSDTGIINWIGTDCSTTDGKSEFTPSANMHYDIVIYYNGSQLVGLVNGYTPATVVNSSQAEATS